jgi:membrane fusion protein, multidrug efflux system
MNHAVRSRLFQPMLLACALVAMAPLACKRGGANAKTDLNAGKPAVAVETAAVVEVDVPATLRVTGTLKGFRETDLAANSAGRVMQTNIERGGQVTAGQVLLQLDTRAAALSASEARAQAASVKAQETQARLECDRFEKLKEKGAISEAEFDRIAIQCRTLPLSAQAASARAQLAAQNVGDGTVRAPFPGIVTERYVDVGEYVRQDTRVVTLVSLDTLRLEMAIPEANVARVKEGAEVAFDVAAYPERRFTGKIRFVSGAVRSTTRDLVAEAIVDNADKSLLPGMFANVELTVGTRKLPAVPKSAIVDRDGKANAFVVIEGKLEQRVLAIGPTVGESVSVTKGVRAGDKVVVRNVATLSNGQPVL